MFHFFGKNKPQLRMVIDVGTHSIKAIAFESGNGNGMPRALKKAVIKLPAHGGKKEGRTPASLTETKPLLRIVIRLRELIFALVKELGRVPGMIVIGFGAGFGDIRLVTWEAASRQKNKIDSTEAQKIFKEFTEKQQDSCCTVLAYPTDFLVNGYEVASSLLKKIPASLLHEFGFRVFLSRMSKDVGRQLVGIKESLGGLPIQFVPLPAVYYEGLLDILPVEDIFMIDVGGEATTLIFCKGGELRAFTSFSYGLHHIARALSEASVLSFDAAEDLLFQYSRGLMNESKMNETKGKLAPLLEEWRTRFLAALDFFYVVGPLPQKLLLIGGGAEIPEIADLLRNPSWFKNYSWADAPLLRVLDATGLFGGERLGGLLDGPDEVGLASLILYSLHHEQLFS